jgi:hypothetical protein
VILALRTVVVLVLLYPPERIALVAQPLVESSTAEMVWSLLLKLAILVLRIMDAPELSFPPTELVLVVLPPVRPYSVATVSSLALLRIAMLPLTALALLSPTARLAAPRVEQYSAEMESSLLQKLAILPSTVQMPLSQPERLVMDVAPLVKLSSVVIMLFQHHKNSVMALALVLLSLLARFAEDVTLPVK